MRGRLALGWLTAALVVGLAPAGALATGPAAATAPGPGVTASRTEAGPRLSVPAAALRRSVGCTGKARRGRTPVLLVHGTGTTGKETWRLGWQQSLRAEGRAVCVVDLPRFGTGDVQDNAQYVVHALRQLQGKAGTRDVSVVALSKGMTETLLALRVWPDVARRVDDVVGLAGVMDRGSRAIAAQCSADPCVPALHQVATGSALLRAVKRHPLPRGVSYTAVSTPLDRTVTPQPGANRQRGVRPVSIDAVCPGRAARYGVGHAQVLGDAVARALVRDALARRGPASPSRVPRTTCGREHFPGFDEAGFTRLAAVVAARRHATTTREPRVRSWLRR